MERLVDYQLNNTEVLEFQLQFFERVAEEIQCLKESNLELEKEVKDLKSLIEVHRAGDVQEDKYGLARRRKVNKWSSLENDTLRAGVEQYGVGRWKLILTSNQGIFGERTQVDLKDKWRNLI
ncbi:hypothetical protein CerSpe_297760 [Prunus speciosa]